jgi:hypothetical protein
MRGASDSRKELLKGTRVIRLTDKAEHHVRTKKERTKERQKETSKKNTTKKKEEKQNATVPRAGTGLRTLPEVQNGPLHSCSFIVVALVVLQVVEDTQHHVAVGAEEVPSLDVVNGGVLRAALAENPDLSDALWMQLEGLDAKRLIREQLVALPRELPRGNHGGEFLALGSCVGSGGGDVALEGGPALEQRPEENGLRILEYCSVTCCN